MIAFNSSVDVGSGFFMSDRAILSDFFIVAMFPLIPERIGGCFDHSLFSRFIAGKIPKDQQEFSLKPLSLLRRQRICQTVGINFFISIIE
jgi:hypothetical protein